MDVHIQNHQEKCEKLELTVDSVDVVSFSSLFGGFSYKFDPFKDACPTFNFHNSHWIALRENLRETLYLVAKIIVFL